MITHENTSIKEIILRSRFKMEQKKEKTERSLFTDKYNSIITCILFVFPNDEYFST